MAEMEELVIAQKYPFSEEAREVVKEKGLNLEQLPEEIINRAALMISYAWKKKPYRLENIASQELLEYEILAFPTAKILLSFINDQYLNEKFCQMIADAAFFHIEKEKNKTQTALNMAKNFGLDFVLTDKQDYFVEMELKDFLKASFSSHLKLVNQSLENGKIFLKENEFARFISMYVFAEILDSLPVNLKGIPDYYKKASEQIKKQLKSQQLKRIELKFGGKIEGYVFAACFRNKHSSHGSL
jgi:DNA primase large subunit